METVTKKQIKEAKKMIKDAYDYTFYTVISGEMSKEQWQDFKEIFKITKSEEFQTLIANNKRLLTLQEIFNAWCDTEKAYSFETMIKLAKDTEDKLQEKARQAEEKK